MEEAMAQIRTSRRYADAFEFRFDMIRDPNITQLMAASRRPCIATCRPVWEGGMFKGSEEQRIKVLEAASLTGVHFVDIELNAAPETVAEFLRRKRDTKVIVSLHLLEATIFDPAKIYRALRATRADVIKFAYNTDDAWEIVFAAEFLACAKRDRQKAIAIAMGQAGEASRVLYRKFGGWATYAAPEDGRGSAAGQIPASLLKKLYRADSLKSSTRVYGVIGNPIRQSKGVHLHNPVFQRSGKDAVYCRFQVSSIGAFMNRMSRYLSGFSVTIPHKQEVMKYLDAIDATAKAIGAVNTVVRRNGKLTGMNMDAAGALDAIEGVRKVKGTRVLIVGAGGAARAIVFEAKRRGAEVIIANRTEAKARELAMQFGTESASMSNLSGIQFDILVNATSVGMVPDIGKSPVPTSILKNKVVFDAVYNPPMTKLLSDANAVGAKIIQGTEMYVNQAALQSGLYTGRKVDKRFLKRLVSRIQ